jgi:hypothetical protein
MGTHYPTRRLIASVGASVGTLLLTWLFGSRFTGWDVLGSLTVGIGIFVGTAYAERGSTGEKR